MSETVEKFSTVANAAKMREALEAVLDAIYYGDIGAMGDCPTYSELEEERKLTEKIKSALSAQPRNCDAGSVEEQYGRFVKVCQSHSTLMGRCKETCPFFCGTERADRCRCFALWAQMPYDTKD